MDIQFRAAYARFLICLSADLHLEPTRGTKKTFRYVESRNVLARAEETLSEIPDVRVPETRSCGYVINYCTIRDTSPLTR